MICLSGKKGLVSFIVILDTLCTIFGLVPQKPFCYGSLELNLLVVLDFHTLWFLRFPH